MPFIVLLTVVLIIAIYLFIKGRDKFTRGGDINRQGEEMKDSIPDDDDKK